MNTRSVLGLVVLFLLAPIILFGPSTNLPGNPADTPVDGYPMTEWVSVQGDTPEPYEEWLDRKPAPQPLAIQLITDTRAHADSELVGPLAMALVNSTLYPDIADELDQWKDDLLKEGWSVRITSATFPTAPELRDYLASVENLASVLLIGDFPVPIYEIGDESDKDYQWFPVDLYFMDLNGVWGDQDKDGKYDSFSGHREPEISFGRLTAGSLTYGKSETKLVNEYLERNHEYRTGNLKLPARALLFADNDWASFSASDAANGLALLYPTDTTIIANPWETSVNVYKTELQRGYQWIQIQAHALPKEQLLYPRARFSFQPPGVVDEDLSYPGIYPDYGWAWQVQQGALYGWTKDISSEVFNRSNAGYAMRYQTGVMMQEGTNRSVMWNAEAPTGSYEVNELVAGDPAKSDGVYRINVEGKLVVDGIPTAAEPLVWGERVVNVDDGMITMSSRVNSVNNRVTYLDITYQDGGPDSILSKDIYTLTPKAFFFNLFSCSAGRYIDPDYVAGWYIFGDTYGLGAIGSTKTGGMFDYRPFYEKVTEGQSIGAALQNWFGVRGVSDPGWFYGVTLFGDPTLRSRLVESDPYEPNNTFEDATLIAYGDLVEGANISPFTGDSMTDDVDFYRFTGQKGERILAELRSPLGSTDFDDSHLILYDQDHNTLRLTGGEPDAQIEHTLNNDGVYYLLVYAGQFNGGTKNPYTLSLDLAPDQYEPNDDFESATLITYHQLVRAAIEGHDDVPYWEDMDFFRFSGLFNDQIRATVDATQVNNLEPYICLYDGAMVEITCDEGTPANALAVVEHTLPVDGDYYLQVSHTGCGEGGDGCEDEYLLNLDWLDPYEPNDTAEQATATTYGSKLVAEIDDHDDVPYYDDVDNYSFDAVAGDLVSITVDSSYYEEMIDAEICLYDEAYTEISCESDWATVTLSATVDSSGRYITKVNAFCSEGGVFCQGRYILDVQRINRAPIATDDTYTTWVGVPVAIVAPGVLGNDNDPDGDPLQAVLVANPSHGTVEVKEDGSFTYTPFADYFGDDSFEYAASDGIAKSLPAVVTVITQQRAFLPVVMQR